jgi:phosphoglycerate dehydrogenase-like enzyme
MKPVLLVIGQPGHAAMRKLEPLRASSETFISNNQAELLLHAPQAEIVLWTGLGAGSVSLPEVWDRARSLRWIHSLGTGVEKIPFPALIDSHIPLTNARGVFKRSLAEFALLGILFHTKRVRRLIDSQRTHTWDSFKVQFADKKVLGIVGFGSIGRECALLAKGAGLIIHAYQRRPPEIPDPLVDKVFGSDQLHQMLPGIDVLLCAAPLTAKTHHLIAEAQFKLMKSTAVVINVGRGPVINESALVHALQTRQIAGASLDVFEHEPLPASSPLWDMDNVLLSPHCTDNTEDPDWLELSMQMFIDNFNRYRKAEPLENIVDKRAGY